MGEDREVRGRLDSHPALELLTSTLRDKERRVSICECCVNLYTDSVKYLLMSSAFLPPRSDISAITYFNAVKTSGVYLIPRNVNCLTQ